MVEIILGTAQMGMKYGINNKFEIPSIKESFEILDYAFINYIKAIDTSPSYGKSEKIIGNWINNKKPLEEFSITTKFSLSEMKNTEHETLEEYIGQLINSSYDEFNGVRIKNYLVHDFADVRKYGEAIFKILEKFKKQGVYENYGCSVYDLEELEFILDNLPSFKVDVVQIPGSIFNQKLLNSNLIVALRAAGVKVMVRSVFVQGLVFMDHLSLPEHLIELTTYLEKLRLLSVETGLSVIELSLGYVMNHPNCDAVIVGIDSLSQLKEVIKVAGKRKVDSHTIEKIFGKIDSRLVDPRYWKTYEKI